MSKSYKGSCLCGAVRFETDEFLPEAAHCHCSMCRKFHGASFATIAGVPRQAFRWLAGEDDLQHYTAGNGTTRSFCGHCGSSLMFSSPGAPSDIVEIALGAFDDDVPVKPSAHIHFASAANWTVLSDDLPRYREQRGSERLAGPQAGETK